ncbi:tetratricopeptide repeat-containing sensor histidine kinase [Pedobacter cryoconitis]|uniref:histidine kinase n=1 Tax=Pedobacter cryoconitis TaxID=188932 RepID=A0A7X0MI04_9SPHI|nr:tetratricopeptide repeat-containing sensor histidine kinase [Pedobacter cryoconitis]MBB6499877.1 signal transduction histidine kinase [Pedobacter cryoconitis]
MRKVLLSILAMALIQIVCYGQSSELNQLQSSLPHITDSLRYTDALNRMAMLLYEKNLDSTFFYTVRARGIANRINYSKGKADALNNLGVFFDLKGNLQLALRYYNEAYHLYTELKDTSNRVQTLMNMAMVYQESGKDKRALAQYQHAFSLGEKLKKDSIMSLAIYNYLLQYPSLIRHDSVTIYIDKARKIATKYRDERTLLALDQLVANDLLSNQHYNEGITLLKKTIDSALSKKLYYVTMDMLAGLADQLAKTDPAAAIASYKQGLEIAGRNGYLISSITMSRRLFELYTQLGDMKNANMYSLQLVKFSDEHEQLNNKSGVDYLDYAIKEQQLSALTTKSNYQTALIILFVVICVLTTAVILSIRQNLNKSKLLNKRMTMQNAQLKLAFGALEQSHADNTRMMQIVAHDLRNPLGSVHSLADLLLSNSSYGNDDRQMLEMIKTSVGHSLELVSDLLQVNHGTGDIKNDPIQIDEMLRYCVSLSMNKAELKKQNIKLQTKPLIIAASREKLWRVISNLIGNAIKFSPEATEIEVNMELSAESVIISIKDEGIGIPADLQDQIFEMFTKAKRQGTAGEQAFGLGLAISRQIVEAHDGKIWFVSNQGKGTTFYVELPLTQGIR